MIHWLLALAMAGPVVLDAPPDPYARCVAEADAVAGLVPSLPAPEGPIERLAIVVGVPCHRSPDIPSLVYSSKDALAVGRRLADEGYHVVPLTTSVDRDQLDQALTEWVPRVAPDGVVLVYFSGHGMLYGASPVRRHLVFSDSELDDLGGTALVADDLEARLAALPVDRTVLVQDTCFASQVEQGTKSIGPSGGLRLLSLDDADDTLRTGEQRLYSSRFFEQAIELPALEGSVYTHHFLGALDGTEADLDGDGCVGTLEAHLSAATRTAQDRSGYQNPQVRFSGADVPLTCSAEATRGVLVNGSEVRSVEPGWHRFEVEAAGYRGSVHLEAGEWVDGAELARERRPAWGIGVGAGVDDLGLGPGVAAGGSIWRLGTDRGRGRWLVGASVLGVPAGTCADCEWYVGGLALVRGGWLEQVGPVAVGPMVELGAGWRRRTDGDNPSALGVGTVGGVGLEGRVGLGKRPWGPALVVQGGSRAAIERSRVVFGGVATVGLAFGSPTRKLY